MHHEATKFDTMHASTNSHSRKPHARTSVEGDTTAPEDGYRLAAFAQSPARASATLVPAVTSVALMNRGPELDDAPYSGAKLVTYVDFLPIGKKVLMLVANFYWECMSKG